MTTVLCWSLLGPAALAAQDPTTPLVTDRPDFTESSEVVGKRTFQLELGTSLEREAIGGGSEQVFRGPQALARFGIHQRVELRLASDGVVITRRPDTVGPDPDTQGADLELGSKWALTSEDTRALSTAIIASVSLPTGGADVSSGGVDPALTFTWARSMPGGFGLSGNASAASLSDADRRFTQATMSVSLGRELWRGLAAYWEVFGLSALERHGPAAWTFDTGVTKAIGLHVQLDATVGRGLTAPSPDWFVSVGLSVRKPATAPAP